MGPQGVSGFDNRAEKYRRRDGGISPDRKPGVITPENFLFTLKEWQTGSIHQ